MVIRSQRPAGILLAVALIVTPAAPALANNYSESLAWQFRTAADQVNQAIILDLLEKRRSGYYAPPSYVTNIERQVNCSLAASATGNAGSQSALNNSPQLTGASAAATGNASDLLNWGHTGTGVASDQFNTGTVGAGVVGSTSASVQGTGWQALNSTQSNGGDQIAEVNRSTACAFGADK